MSLVKIIAGLGYPEPVEEFQFARPRRWRFDYAWPGSMVALEVEGGTWSRGRHTRGKGYENDCRKYSTAAVMGWKVVRCTTGMIDSGEVWGFLDCVLHRGI